MVFEPFVSAERSNTSSSLLYDLKCDHSSAWVRLIDTYASDVYRRCRHCGLRVEEAEDIVQEVFTAVSRSIDRYQPMTGNASFRKWLGTITTNKLKDYWRKHLVVPLATGGTSWHNLVQSLEDSLADESSSEPVQNPEDSWVEIIHSVRAETTSRDWLIFERVVLEEKAPADIALEFKVSNNVVYLVRSRLLRKMRELLAASIV